MLPLEKAKKEIIDLVKNASGAKDAKEADLTFPPDVKMGDLSLACFRLAQEMKKNPAQVAVDLAKKIKTKGLVAKVTSAGPYLNFFLNREKVYAAILSAKPAHFFSIPAGGGGGEGSQRVMMEFVSPNNNKPLHLGHLRNAFLGESVARLLEARGAKVVRSAIFNDRGLAIAKSMVAYKIWGKDKTPQKLKIKGDKFVGDLYVEFEKNKGTELIIDEGKVTKKYKYSDEDAERIVQLWEQGDKQTRALWKKLNTWALNGFKDTFKRLKIKFDVSYFESRLWQKGKEIAQEGLAKGIFKKDATGAVMVDLSDYNLPPKVIVRSDGTAIYATTDLYLGKEKFAKNKLTRAIWCVGSEQDLYLKQLFAIYKKFGFAWADKCEHLSYGLVFLPEGKMKSREGKVVEADDLLDHLQGLVVKEIKTRHKLTAGELKKRSEIIAQAALRFYLLSVTPKTTVHFNPEESISFTGHTGPYLLYTYARIESILRKKTKIRSVSRRTKSEINSKFQIPNSDCEWQLVFHMARFSEIVAEAAQKRDPASLAQYLYTLCQQFSNFYENVPVLKAEAASRAARLSLIKRVQEVLAEGLRLLTIETVEKM